MNETVSACRGEGCYQCTGLNSWPQAELTGCVCVLRGYRADSKLVRRVHLRADCNSVCSQTGVTAKETKLYLSACVRVSVSCRQLDRARPALLCVIDIAPKGCCPSSRIPTGGCTSTHQARTHMLKRMPPPCSTSAGGGTWARRSTCTQTL